MRLDPYLNEWLNLFARWFHVFAGILWIGTTYYFTWLDARLSETEAHAKPGEPAQVWMVHSGGFYVVDKRKTPGTETLHWFRWEAALTWLSGVFLLVLIYYMGGALVDPDVCDISLPYAIAFGVGLLIFGWVVYDLLLRSPLGKNEKAFAVITYILVVDVIYLMTHVLSGRAAYIHIGAMFGTIMAANVWMRILPAQRRMIAATRGESTETQVKVTVRTYGIQIQILGFIGAHVGAFIGFLLRPAAPIVGQLPLDAVIIRGRGFHGLDLLLVSYAETSFNYMLAGLIIGGVTGAVIGYLLSRKNPEGQMLSSTDAARAKLRSKQNTYMVLPTVFTMISNHFPTATYGSRYNWLILSILILVGWLAAKIIRRQ